MRRNRLLSTGLVVFFLILFGQYFIRHKDDFSSLLNLNLSWLLLVALGFIALIFVGGIFIKLSIKPFDKSISVLEGFYISLLSSIGNYFGPLLGGTGIRAVYLKKKIGLNYTDFISTLYGYYLIVFLINSLFGLIALLLLKDHFQEPSYILLSLSFAAIFISLILIIRRKVLARQLLSKILGKRVNKLNQMSESWQKITAQPKLIAYLTTVALVNLLILILVVYIEFLLIDTRPSLGALILYSVLGSFSILISLTPGALGIREALFIFSAGVLGVANTQILAVALIDRGVQFFVMLLAWFLVSIYRRKYFSDH